MDRCLRGAVICLVCLSAADLMLAVSGMASSASDSTSPTVHVSGLGSLRGAFSSHENESKTPTNISCFLGIPYAKAPVGDLRWRPPQVHGAWASPRDAVKFGDACMQKQNTNPPGPNQTMSEDCLFLNVYAPTAALNGNKKLPVMVWIHGGAYMTGSSNLYPSDGLVLVSNLSLVVVTLNYRLNIFGFLGADELRSRAEDGSTGNFGIQDQRLAMAWVRDHIAGFGGDGRDVTIFGESAGGNSVIDHLTQKDSFSLYTKATVESGAYQGSIPMQKAESFYSDLKRKEKCKETQCLLALSSSEVFASLGPLSADGQLGPVVDGVALSDLPLTLLTKGKYNHRVPVMIGSNRDETAFFALIDPVDKLVPPNMTDAELDVFLADRVRIGEVERVKKLYDSAQGYPYPKDLGPFNQNWWTAVRVSTDSVPGLGPCAVRNVARNLVAGGTPNVFTYLFAHPTQGSNEIPGTGKGSVVVPHASEIVFVLGGVDRLLPGAEADLALQMATYWSNFARFGNPNGAKLPEWPHYSEEADTILHFGTAGSEGGITSVTRERKQACDYWDRNPQRVPASSVEEVKLLVI